MKNFSKFFLVAAASTMMFTSCSSDEPNGGQTPAEGDIYARLTLSFLREAVLQQLILMTTAQILTADMK